VEIGFEARSSRFSMTDERWLSQVADLTTDLDRATGVRSRRERPVAGAKGVLSDVIVPLGSAGVFSAAVEVVKAWLGRDSTRSLKLTWSDNGRLESLELTGATPDEAELTRLRSLIDGSSDE
jgi:hypothetical protein